MRQSLGYDARTDELSECSDEVLLLVVSGNSLVKQVPLRVLATSNGECLCGQECPVCRVVGTSVLQLGTGVMRYKVGYPIGISREEVQIELLVTS